MQRFLLEVQDVLRLKTFQPRLSLEDSTYAIAPKLTHEMQKIFLQGLPFCYLLQRVDFFGHQFYVNQEVLIPRPETELLVELAIKKATASQRRYENILDVGTGSGVILLSLLSTPHFTSGRGADISAAALEVASINARRLRLPHAHFHLGDRLQGINGKFDFIISNPPYIKASAHRNLVHQSVNTYEPSLALYLDDLTYDAWFEHFFRQVKLGLAADGLFMMEGHELELQHQAQMLEALGFKQVKVLRDYAGSDRFLEATI